jgi:hypothetical protein
MAAAALFTSEPAFDSAISVLKGVFCLNHEERAEVSASTAAYGFGDFGGIDALECVVNGVGPTGLEDLMGLVSVDGGGYAALGDLLPLMIECGAIDDSTFEELGVTAVQVGCVLAELGEEGLGVLDPSAEAPELSQLGPILGALNKCGIELEGIFESLELPVDPVAEVDPTALPKVEVELKIPEELPDIDLPFTEEQIACLTIELGEEKIAALLAGAVPDLSLFTAFATCKVDLATLLGG